MTSKPTIECPVCKRHFRCLTTQHIRTHGFPDAASFKELFGLEYLRAPDIRQRQSKMLQERNPTADGHSAESIEKMSRNRRGKGKGVAGKYERTAAIRDKISASVTAHHLSNKGFQRGEWVPCRKAGKDVFVRSSWEARIIRTLDAHPDVVAVEVEPLVIPYQFEGERRYMPDLLVTFEGDIRELWEVKPTEFIGHPKNQAKFKALNEYVSRHGMNACIVTLNGIESLEREAAVRTALEM